MTSTQHTSGRSAVVGVFHDRARAERAVEALKDAGFDDDQIGIAARGEEDGAVPRAAGASEAGDASHGSGETGGSDHSAGAATGALAGGVLGALAGAGAALLIPGVGPVVAGGILASALGGAAIGVAAGGLIGALTGLGISEEEAQYYDEEVRAGRYLVTVRADGRYQEARDLLRRYGAYDFADRDDATTSAATSRASIGAQRPAAALAAGARGADTYAARMVGDAAREQRDEGEIRVPEVEERLEVTKRPVQAGEVQIHREVHEEHQTVPVELMREEVHVEQREVPARQLTAGEEAFQEGTIRVPVHAEEAIARKQAVVTGEVVVDKTSETETQQVADTVRRTTVHVDEDRQQATTAGNR